ncbi:MAG: hypothetical protein ACJ766_06485 [Thermoleophilaceae bacterium]
MHTLVIQHHVNSFEAWRKAFDDDPVARAESGVARHAIFRPADDPNSVVIELDFPTREQADRMLAALRGLWARVGERIGFGGPENVETRILDRVEVVNY